MRQAQVRTKAQPYDFQERVWFTGSTAVLEGQAFCYDLDYGTASAADGTRCNAVSKPDNTNNLAFAGVAIKAYDAADNGQWINIYGPGSFCNILGRLNYTLGQDEFTTMTVGGTYAGYFSTAGHLGRGTARVLQTVNRSVTNGLVFAQLLDGPWESGGVETVAIAAGGGAITPMDGGVSLLGDQAVSLTSDATYTLADANVAGLKKSFEVAYDMGDSKDIKITVTTGIQADDSSALNTITADDDGDRVDLVWTGAVWKAIYHTGATFA